MGEWDRMRALIEAGWHSGYTCPKHPCDQCATATVFTCCAAECPDCIPDTKQAQHDGSRQIYGDAGKFMRGGERR